MLSPPPTVSWAFLDLNSYFASVEQNENPHLLGKPVAIVPMLTDSTCAIAASYEAKKYGIKTGTRIYEAKQLCPDLVCVLARHDKYVEYHHRILSVVIKHMPIDKVWSIDELSSRLPLRLQNIDTATRMVSELKQDLKESIGTAIRCSIGLAPNSYLAKVATDMQKPDGLTILTPENMQQKLCALKLQDLPGIGMNMEARLHKKGIRSISQLWHLSPKQARAIWGSVEGERLWYNLHGIHVPTQPTSHSLIGHSRILDPAHRHPDIARLVARRLTIKAATRLRRMELYACAFDLSVRIIDPIERDVTQRWAGGIKLKPMQDNFTALKALEDLWATMLRHEKPHRLKKISVRFTGLQEKQQITADLFDKASPITQIAQKKNHALSAVMDKINAKYGAEALRLGISPKTSAGFVGTKIAFSRIPDMAEFNE